MRGIYTYSFVASGVSTEKSLFVFQGAPDASYSVYDVSVTNKSNETNEQLEASLQRITTFGAPSGTLVAAAKHSPRDSSCGAYAWANVSVAASEPTYTGSTQVGRRGFSSLGGYDFSPIPETRFDVGPSGAFGLRLLVAPSSSVDLTGSVTVQEFP